MYLVTFHHCQRLKGKCLLLIKIRLPPEHSSVIGSEWVSSSTARFHLRAPFLYNNRRGRVGCRCRPLTCPVFRAFLSQDEPRWWLIPTIKHLWRPECSCVWSVYGLLSVSLQLQNPVRLKKKDLECWCLMRSHHRKHSLFFLFFLAAEWT